MAEDPIELLHFLAELGYSSRFTHDQTQALSEAVLRLQRERDEAQKALEGPEGEIRGLKSLFLRQDAM